VSSEAIVVKIGGSLARPGSALARVVELMRAAGRPLAIVPGGGAFADAVRAAQADVGFSDEAAHRMAILAMHQTGLMLTALAPEWRAYEDVSDIAAGLARGETAVWLPLKECEGDERLPASWETTSDAIAARLAERLGGLKVVFVKSRTAGREASAEALAADGLIDPVAARIIREAGLPFAAMAADEEARLREILAVSLQVDAPPGPC